MARHGHVSTWPIKSRLSNAYKRPKGRNRVELTNDERIVIDQRIGIDHDSSFGDPVLPSNVFIVRMAGFGPRPNSELRFRRRIHVSGPWSMPNTIKPRDTPTTSMSKDSDQSKSPWQLELDEPSQ